MIAIGCLGLPGPVTPVESPQDSTPGVKGQFPAGEAYMFQAGPTTIPSEMCEPLDISRTPQPSISIDPIGWRSTGEQFLITGTTLLPADQEILVKVMTADFMSHKAVPLDFFGQTGTIRSTTESNGIGRWEFTVNTSGWVPDKYLIQITPLAGNGSFGFISYFYLLSPDEALAIRQLPVTVDPVPYHHESDTFLIGGNTTLPVGQELAIFVKPGSFSLRTESAPEQNNLNRGVTGKTRVEPGTHGINRWSFNLNTTDLDSTTYIIDIFSPSGELMGKGVFFLDYNPGRICRILTVPVTPVLTPAQIPAADTGSTSVGNGLLSVHPIGDHAVGENFSINGTAILPAGIDITISIYRGSFSPGFPPQADPWYDHIPKTVRVKYDNKTGNIWSYAVNTTGSYPDEYIVFVEYPGDSTINATAIFNLVPGADKATPGAGQKDDYVIMIDPIGDHTEGEIITITGTTNLPPGEKLLIEVISSNNTFGSKVKDNSGAVRVVDVREGVQGKNTWSFMVNSSDLKPDNYTVIVNSYLDVPVNDSLFSVIPEENNPQSSSFFTLDANPVDSPTRASPHSAGIIFGSLVTVTFLITRRMR